VIVVRPAAEADAVALAAIYAPIVTGTAISFEVDAPDAQEMARRLALTAPSTPWLVCSDADEILGYAYAGPHRARAAYRWCVDVSVYVAAAAGSRGVGHGLYATLLALLERQGFHRAYAGITLPNAASVGLHERLGFTPLGVYRAVGFKLGAWHDVGWWERPLAAAATPPAEPIRFTDLEADPAVRDALAEGASRVRA
jgi:phosphinothricin acetyltransferase